MPDHAEREFQGRIERDGGSGGITVVAVQKIFERDVREKAESAGEAVFEDDAEAKGRDEVVGVQYLERMFGVGKTESESASEAGVKLRVESLVDLAQGGVVENAVCESVGGVVGVGVEFSLIGRAGAGVAAVSAADTQGPRIAEIVSDRQCAVVGYGAPSLPVVEERADVVIQTDFRSALDGEEPALPMLVGRGRGNVGTGGEPRRTGEQQRGKNGKIFFHDIGLFGE